ncbi:hypothetical protein E2562_024519 [Oryza meyeriana var. granulata]|uniref:Uncharacterized protein n=1 Tax=Oryza meyeriana var. granulata TaxID=110450 RepID=A0A6G1BNW9_9ORYZ|nr:hypothetical protein E2562_024519 [Oryza meyeriana var. granulata]
MEGDQAVQDGGGPSVQAPLLPAPGAAQGRLCRTKCYKKPLSPGSLKMIIELVHKGGCKNVRLKAAKKAVTIVPP